MRKVKVKEYIDWLNDSTSDQMAVLPCTSSYYAIRLFNEVIREIPVDEVNFDRKRMMVGISGKGWIWLCTIVKDHIRGKMFTHAFETAGDKSLVSYTKLIEFESLLSTRIITKRR